MENGKTKKKLTISGKPKKTFVPKQNLESKNNYSSNNKKFLKLSIRIQITLKNILKLSRLLQN